MEKVLISACLLGDKVRYDGGDSKIFSEYLDLWEKDGRLVPICPEVEGNLGVPRLPAEIQNGDGIDVLHGRSKIINQKGVDVTQNFLEGAKQTLELVRINHIKIAVLKSLSPSCGSGEIYDGSFSSQLKEGDGITTALLKENGLKVFTENQLEEAHKVIKTLES
jgi:uncharacterized protein YbbK (DUF523 family)